MNETILEEEYIQSLLEQKALGPWLEGLNLGERVAVGAMGIEKTGHHRAAPGIKVPQARLASWPYPEDSQLERMPFAPEGSVAVLAPGPVFEMIKLLRFAYHQGGEAVGVCRSNTIGVERIVANLVGNPNYRYLFIVGPHGVHRPERALVNLHSHGMDEQGNIQGIDPWHPRLHLLARQPLGIVERFQRQITIIDLSDRDISRPVLALLLALCHQPATFRVTLFGKEHTLGARGALTVEGRLAEPLAFQAEELNKIDIVSAGSYALTALVAVSVNNAYRMTIGSVLEHGQPLAGRGLHVRNLGVSISRVNQDRIPVPTGLRGLGLDDKDHITRYLDAYGTWTHLLPYSTILWDGQRETPLPQIDLTAPTYGTRLCVAGQNPTPLLAPLEALHHSHQDSLPTMDDILALYDQLENILPGQNQIAQILAQLRSDMEGHAMKDSYPLSLGQHDRFIFWPLYREGALSGLGLQCDRGEQSSLNWFPTVYGGIRFGQFIARALGLKLGLYVHRCTCLTMSQSEVDWFRR